jgi:hypothetical protein
MAEGRAKHRYRPQLKREAWNLITRYYYQLKRRNTVSLTGAGYESKGFSRLYVGKAQNKASVGAILLQVVGAVLMIGTMAFASMDLAILQEMMNPGVVVASGHVEPSREELRKAHRYHGTIWSFEDKNHVWHFYNKDGQQCKLFKYKEEKN